MLPDVEKLLKREQTLVLYFCLVQFSLFVVWVLEAINYIFTYGKGYWILLFMYLLAIAYGSYELQIEGFYLGSFYITTAIIASGGCAASIYLRLLPGFAGIFIEVKILFSGLSCALAALTGHLLIRKYLANTSTTTVFDRPEDYLIRSWRNSCVKTNLFSLAAFFCAILVIFASAHSVADLLLAMEYLPEKSDYINVDGHLVRIRCSGSGSPTVLFVHGIGGSSLDFYGVQSALERTTRTCSYDRLGNGYSRKLGPSPRVSEQQARELEMVLAKLNITEDFIAVGHSFGGLILRSYNHLYPGRIKGMVLVDAVTPEDFSFCNPNIKYAYIPGYYISLVLVDGGWWLNLFDFFDLWDTFGVPVNLYANKSEEFVFLMRSPSFITALGEFESIGVSCTSVKQLLNETIDFPLSLVIAENGIHRASLNEAIEVAELSPNGTAIVVTNSSHLSVLVSEKYFNVTAQEIERIVENYRAT